MHGNSFETDEGMRFEFPIVASHTDSEDAHYEIQGEETYEIVLSDKNKNKARAKA